MDVGISIVISLVIFVVLVGMSFYFAPKSNLTFLTAIVIAAIVSSMLVKFS